MPELALTASRLTAPRFEQACAARARGHELSQELRSAALDGDEGRISKLLGELLRCKGLSRGQRIALQHKALVNLVHSLRCAALNDDLTGLFNRRGFVQMGTRLLDLAARDGQAAYLVHFDVLNLADGTLEQGSVAAEMLARHVGNLLRDLFPNYGVYEALGRLDTHQFVALTLRSERAEPAALLAAARAWRAEGLKLRVRVSLAHFDPAHPVAIDGLMSAIKPAQETPPRELTDREAAAPVAA